EELSGADGPWSLRHRMAPAELALNREILGRRQWQPQFDAVLVLDDGKGAIDKARRTIASLQAQAYPNWRLLVAPRKPGAKPGQLGERLSAGFDDIADRIQVVRNLTADALGRAAAGAVPLGDWFVTV